MIYGVKYPHTENIQVLIDHGAKIDAVTDSGMTALMWASSYGHLANVKLLVEKGAKIDIVDNNERTALHIATIKKQNHIASYLE